MAQCAAIDVLSEHELSDTGSHQSTDTNVVPFASAEATTSAKAKGRMLPPNVGMSKTLKIREIIENLFYIGLSSFTMWEFAVAELKINSDIVSDPVLMQLYCMINQLYLVFSRSIHTSDLILSQEKLPLLLEKQHTLDELLSYLKPEINKKVFKDKIFSLEYVQKLMAIVKKIVIKKTALEQKPTENKRKKLTKRSKKNLKKPKREVLNLSDSSSSDSSASNSSSNSSGSSSSSSSSSDDDEPAGFEALFKQSKKRGSVISQKIQFNKHGKTKGFETPGEKGTHFIKMEITDMKDLKGIEPFNYWRHVQKKAQFVINTKEEEDKAFLKDINKKLYDVALRIKKIENIKPLEFKSTKSFQSKKK